MLPQYNRQISFICIKRYVNNVNAYLNFFKYKHLKKNEEQPSKYKNRSKREFLFTRTTIELKINAMN